ncbi:MAG: NAD(P)H-dependent oxidoreductase subunit E [Clostridia bacterium]
MQTISNNDLLELMDIVNNNRNDKGALMPVLQQTQDLFGYIPQEAAKIISKELNVSLAKLYGVITFYSQFKLEPSGEYTISVCLGTACYVRGASKLIEAIEKELGIKLHETTSNRKFTLVDTRCLGACGLAPIMTINDDVYGKVTVDNIPEILKKY